MPKNRDYTGLVRTPASMAWLIGHRAKLKGQLDRAEAQLAGLPERITQLRLDLKAIDSVIPHHEVKLDPSIIQGKRTYAPRIFEAGEMTRDILRILRQAAPAPLFTFEIAFQLARRAEIDVPVVGESLLMDRVSHRLRAMVKLCLVVRHHETATTSQGSWSLDPNETAD